MRKVGTRVVIVAVLLALAGAGGYRLMSASDGEEKAIRVGTTDNVTALDPAGAYDGGSWAMFSNLYQSLLTFTPGSSRPEPDAARDCAFQGGELTRYVCLLRPGLRFSSGRAVTAEDVKFSFDRVRAIGDGKGPGTLLDTLKRVRAEGSDKVVFELRSPDATFPFKIATGAGSIVDRHDYPADRLRTGTRVTGSGPYLLDRYVKGDRAELRPNPDYQGAVDTGAPVTVRYFTTAEELSAAWERRQVDVVGKDMPPRELADLNPADPKIKYMESTGATTRNLVFDLRGDSPMREPAVRRAVAAVVDREAIARDVHARTVDPLYSLIPQGMNGHTTPYYDTYPRPDPGRAERLLREAGIVAPVRFSLGFARGDTTEREAVTVRRQLEATGLFKVSLERREWEAFQEDFARGRFDAFLISWIADFPDPDTFTTPLVGPESAFHNGYREARVNRLIRATQFESERSRTVVDFRTIQRIVADDVPMVPLWQKKDTVLSTNSIAGTQYLADATGMWRLWKLRRI
ncbi:ABC transporter substrate-binding protein [Streptomyces sp. SAJ15]|uniref:ABC transporter substrate-binding protein n=1 Tax=Streptomyces sp. SAJ15 TaxID=2011095 RepID=UPI0021B35941|nr:ABC transporter substrate-binding protein [Streptomyces sp. SAJ15]